MDQSNATESLTFLANPDTIQPGTSQPEPRSGTMSKDHQLVQLAEQVAQNNVRIAELTTQLTQVASQMQTAVEMGREVENKDRRIHELTGLVEEKELQIRNLTKAVEEKDAQLAYVFARLMGRNESLDQSRAVGEGTLNKGEGTRLGKLVILQEKVRHLEGLMTQVSNA